MKGQSGKTKVVVRHLPSTIPQAMFMEQVDVAFAGRYKWVSFRPGKSGQKHHSYSRAYIDFKSPEDVIEFAEFFNGHLFVNEKGAQFKAIVEYSPSQRVPKQSSKKDGREGAIYKDPEYLKFLELIAKPVENLPSAEIQLERREAERAGGAKDAPIITPLMDFVQQKRAAKIVSRRILANGKLSKRLGASRRPSSSSSNCGSEKKRVSKTMYVLRETAKSMGGKDKSIYILPKRDDQQLSDKAATSASGTEVLEVDVGISGVADAGKKKVLLLKGEEKEILPVSGSISMQQKATSSEKNVTAGKNSQQREASGRIIRSILLKGSQSSGDQSGQKTQNTEKENRPLRPPHVQLVLKDTNGAPGDMVANDLLVFSSEKQEKRTRNKDRPDSVVWSHLRQSDGSHGSDESLSSSASQSTQSVLDSSQGNYLEIEFGVPNSKSEVKILGSGRNSRSLDNGSHKHFGRRGLSHTVKDSDDLLVEGKSLKRGGASGYGSHEKQVWVQKSSSGS